MRFNDIKDQTTSYVITLLLYDFLRVLLTPSGRIHRRCITNTSQKRSGASSCECQYVFDDRSDFYYGGESRRRLTAKTSELLDRVQSIRDYYIVDTILDLCASS